MYETLAGSARAARRRLVVNGGAITLDEVERNLAQRRPIVVLAGSGRAADAIVAHVRGIEPPEPAVRQLQDAVAQLGLDAHRDLVHVVDLGAGPAGLTERLAVLLGRAA
jgi:hypothetical protein